MFRPPKIVLQQGRSRVIPHRDYGVHGGSCGRRSEPMQDQLTGGRSCDLPCLHDDDALVPRFDRFEELHLHRQGLERDQLLAVLVLHLEQLRERAQVTQQLLIGRGRLDIATTEHAEIAACRRLETNARNPSAAGGI